MSMVRFCIRLNVLVRVCVLSCEGLSAWVCGFTCVCASKRVSECACVSVCVFLTVRVRYLLAAVWSRVRAFAFFPVFRPFSVVPIGLASGIPEVLPVPFAALPTLCGLLSSSGLRVLLEVKCVLSDASQ